MDEAMKDVDLTKATGAVERLIDVDKKYNQLSEVLTSSESGQDSKDYVGMKFNPNTFKLFSKLVEQEKKEQVLMKQGVFPSIRRAWFTIDSHIYLWDYVDGSDFCVYKELDEVIVAVALVTPTPGVFDESIQHLLVLATPMTVYLIGVHFTAASGSQDFIDLGTHRRSLATEMHLRFDPAYQVATDNVTVLSIAGTADGRIFMGGNDGCLYEIQYQGSDSWLFARKCTKINHSQSKLSFLVPSVIKSLLNGAPDDIQEIAVDDSRNIIYVFSQHSIRYYTIGEGAAPGQQVREGGVIWSDTGARNMKNYGKIIAIFPIPRAECASYGLVAVTDQGARLYFGNFGDGHDSHMREIGVRHVRVLPQELPGLIDINGIVVTTATLSQGVFVLSGFKHERADSHVVLSIAPDGYQNVFSARSTAPGIAAFNYREVCTAFNPGCVVTAIAEIPQDSNTYLSDDRQYNPLMNQHLPRREFVLLTTQGTYRFIHTRPVELLEEALNRNIDAELFRFFFPDLQSPEIVRAVNQEACATAYVVACTSGPHRAAALAAIRKFGGAPQFVGAGDVGKYGAAILSATLFSGKHEGACLFMGRLLRDVWPHPIAVSESGSEYKRLVSRCTLRSIAEHVQYLEKLRAVLQESELVRSEHAYGASREAEETLVKMHPMFQVRTYRRDHRAGVLHREIPTDLGQKMEEESFVLVFDLLVRSIEVLKFWAKLMQEDFTAILGGLAEEDRKDLCRLQFSHLIVKEDLCKKIIAHMLKRVSEDDGKQQGLKGLGSRHDQMSAELKSICPSLHGQEDIYRSKALQSLQALDAGVREEDLRESVRCFRMLFENAKTSKSLEDACKKFMSVGYWEGIQELVSVCAERPYLAPALDFYKRDVRGDMVQKPGFDRPAKVARPESSPAVRRLYEERLRIYACLTAALDKLWAERHTRPPPGKPSAREYFNNIVDGTLKRHDELAHVAVFDWFCENALHKEELPKLRSEYLETYLTYRIRSAGKPDFQFELELSLTKYYESIGKNASAAAHYESLALSQNFGLKLAERIQFLSNAITCAKTVPEQRSSGLAAPVTGGYQLQRLNEMMDVMKLQEEISDSVKALPVGPTLDVDAKKGLLADLDTLTLPIDDLRAISFDRKLYECQLAVCYTGHVTNLAPIWDQFIKHELDKVRVAAPAERSAKVTAFITKITDAIRKNKDRGVSLYLKDIVLRLEEVCVETKHSNKFEVMKALASCNLTWREMYQEYNEVANKSRTPLSNSMAQHLNQVIRRILLEWVNKTPIDARAANLLERHRQNFMNLEDMPLSPHGAR